MINIVLLAGKGQRFVDAGYTVPKPLLPVRGKPMIIQATKGMPQADKWVFVIKEEHLQEKELLEVLKSVGPDVSMIIDPNPIGQLNSCLVAREYYDNEEPIFIGACDFDMVYDRTAYSDLMHNGDASVISWSFTHHPGLVRNPQAWGWLKQDDQGVISAVSVKVPISDDPFNDFAITGSFSFRSGKEFIHFAEELIRRDMKVKNEFYIDSLIGIALEEKKKVVSFPVEYIGWGTPADYEEYMAWEDVFLRNAHRPENATEEEYSFWQRYFLNT